MKLIGKELGDSRQNIPEAAWIHGNKGRLPPRNKGLIAGLSKGNQWVFIVPKNKAGYFLGVPRGIGGNAP